MNNPLLILGTAQIEPSYGATRQSIASNQDWREIFAEARTCGFSALDSAELYPEAHKIIGQSGWDGQIHTKLASMASAKEDFARAKRDLRRNDIDLVYFHRPPTKSAEMKKAKDLAVYLKGRGARFVGLSVYRPAELQAAFEIDEITHVQIPLNVLDQRFLGEGIARLKSKGKRIIVRSVFLQGLLASNAPLETFRGVPRDLLGHIERFRSEAASQQVSPAQFALSFVKGISGINGVILGCETISQVRESSAVWKRIKLHLLDLENFSKLKVKNENLIDPRSW